MRLPRTTSRPAVRTLAPWVLLVAVVVAGVLLSPGALLALAPAVVLFAALLSGSMPGEELLERLRARFEPRARRPRRPRLRPYAAVYLRRTGRLIAAALAVRPPPRAAATA